MPMGLDSHKAHSSSKRSPRKSQISTISTVLSAFKQAPSGRTAWLVCSGWFSRLSSANTIPVLQAQRRTQYTNLVACVTGWQQSSVALRVGRHQVAVLGLGDTRRALTLTANTAAIRSAAQQGVWLEAATHRAAWLVGV
eukprot:1144077-Pelagomonas_calceolata.AAC.2